MKNIISRVATTYIFWAADFFNYADVVGSIYDEIPNISNYHHFRVTNANEKFDFKHSWDADSEQWIVDDDEW